MSSLDDVMAALKRIEAKIDAKPAAVATAATRVPDDGVDELVKFDPKKWTQDGNPPVAPCLLSNGPLDWLQAVASFSEWKAKKMDAAGEKNDRGEPKSFFEWRRAARAKGWIGRVPPTNETPTQTDLLDADVPF